MKLGWVIFGGNKNENKRFGANAFSKECNLDEMVSKFCEIKSCGVSENEKASILLETGQRTLNIF